LESPPGPSFLTRWALRNASRRQRERTEQSFGVPRADIAARGYALSINRDKKVAHEAVLHLPLKELLAKLNHLEQETQE
jgi:type I restriction enzyme M protein